MTIVSLMLQMAFIPPGWAGEFVDLPPGKCGIYSLQVSIDAIYGESRSRSVLDEPLSEQVDHSLQDLHDAARELGLTVFPVRWKSVPDIPYGEAPAILPVVNREGRRHFVAALAAQDSQLLICDFPHKPAWIPESALRNRFLWDGSALHMSQVPEKITRLRWLASMPRPSSLALVASSLVLLVSVHRRRRSIRQRQTVGG